MIRSEILTRLRDAGITQAEIARKCRVSNPTVCQVISGRSISARIQAAVAEAIGLPVDDVFPPAAINDARR